MPAFNASQLSPNTNTNTNTPHPDEFHYNGVNILSLASNKISSTGATIVAASIAASSCTLTDLNLSYNTIIGNGAAELGNALNVNSTITNLDLSVNRLGCTGGVPIGASFANNKTLLYLNLEQNNISTKSTFVIASNLRRNKSMKKLMLKGNNLGEQGGRSMFRAIFDGVPCFAFMSGCSFAIDSTEGEP